MDLIKKTEVIDGVYFVEINEVDLKILCGTPGDIVKHLIKKGFVLWQEKDGVKFETGPNAILLSDKMIQQGEVSNLAEFPVLQMLYRQGMIIPNHPNNTGIKPILIGKENVVKSQLDYIYRGNYGLVDKKELEESGEDKELIEQIWDIKLKFAFGSFKTPDNLIDTCIVNDSKVEIRDGVFIERLEYNVYKIYYKNKSVKVDLNIKFNYESPYSLVYFNVPRDYFSVIHSGQGDGWNIHEPSMSSVLIFQGKIYLIDVGPNIENILKSLGIGFNEIEGVFHTHAHDDHFAGITSLFKSNKKLKYYTTKLVRLSVIKKLNSLIGIDEKEFNKYFDVYDLELDNWNLINGLEVKPILSPHPVENNIFLFRVRWINGDKVYAHFADLTAKKVLKEMIKEKEGDLGISRDFYNKTIENYLTPVDIKKLDVGGGMIHGEVIDFKEDKSKKIILSHLSNYNLSPISKSIGSSASFGSIDVLIEDKHDFLIDITKKYILDIFPTITNYQLNMLLNLDFILFNPGTILIKAGETYDYMYLIVAGIAESILNDNISYLNAGTLTNAIDTITEKPQNKTIRAVSYVTALKVPLSLATNIIFENNLYDKALQKNYIISLLRQTALFGEEISYFTYSKIYDKSEFLELKEGDVLDIEYNKMYFVIEGLIKSKDKIFNSGDFINDINSVFNIENKDVCHIYKDSKLFSIDISTLEDIPVVRWRLYEKIINKI